MSFLPANQGASIPFNTLEQVPLPLPLPSPPFPSPFFPPVRSRLPLLRLGDLGERFSSPSGSGRSPAAKRYFNEFQAKNLASSNDLQHSVFAET